MVTATGTLLCIVAGFIPAPKGLLTDGSISLIQALPGSRKLVMILVPALLFIAATVMVAAGRYAMVSLITVLAGSCIFAWMDLSFINSSMAFRGTLLNEFGIVIALSGVLLHALGTPKTKSPKVESVEKTEDPFLEIENEMDREAAVIGNQADFYESFENATDKPSFMSRDSLEFQNTLTALLRGTPGIQEEAGEPAEDFAPAENQENFIAAEAQEDFAAAEAQEENEADEAPKEYTLVLSAIDEGLEALIVEDSGETEEALVTDIPEKVATEETATVAPAANPLEDTIVLDTGYLEQFIDEE